MTVAGTDTDVCICLSVCTRVCVCVYNQLMRETNAKLFPKSVSVALGENTVGVFERDCVCVCVCVHQPKEGSVYVCVHWCHSRCDGFTICQSAEVSEQ